MTESSRRPAWYPDSKVFCDGFYLFSIGSTKPKLYVDYWSATCPYYSGARSLVPVMRRVDRFKRKYGSLFAFFCY